MWECVTFFLEKFFFSISQKKKYFYISSLGFLKKKNYFFFKKIYFFFIFSKKSHTLTYIFFWCAFNIFTKYNISKCSVSVIPHVIPQKPPQSHTFTLLYLYSCRRFPTKYPYLYNYNKE